jgi:hypothetical protein
MPLGFSFYCKSWLWVNVNVKLCVLSPQVDSWSKISILIWFLSTKYNFIQSPFLLIWLLNAFETEGYLIHYFVFCWFCAIACFGVFNCLCLSFNVMLFVIVHLFLCVCLELWIKKHWNESQGQQQNQNPTCCHITSQIDVSPTNTSMHGSLNFLELHQGYWGVIRLLRILLILS